MEMVDERTSGTEEIPGQEFGEGYLMWRCTVCGEMDEIEDGMPEVCPSCGAEKEALTEVRED
jgi:rubrerythrin